MTNNLFIQNVRPMGGDPVDLLIEEGIITQMGVNLPAPSSELPTIDGQNQLLETIQTNVAPIFNALAATVKSSGISLGKGQEPSVSDFQQPAQRDDRASGGLQNPHDGPA